MTGTLRPTERSLGLIAAALLVAGCAHSSGPTASTPVGPGFISDDWSGALARAKAEGKPLFVDAWAPWCHTCVSMKAYVFPDPALASVADRFVWLEVDTEKRENRAFVERFPQEAWPTLMVVDSRSGEPVRRWLGSATAAELAARLNATALALTPGAPGTPGQAALAQASAADAAGDHPGAASALRYALAVTAPRSLDHGQAAEALSGRLEQDGHPADCLEVARSELSRVAPGTALANLASTGLSCALDLPEGTPGRAAALRQFEERVAALTRDPSVVLLADDRSSLFETLVGARKARGDLRGAHAAAESWAAFLDGEAARAGSPAARAVFDSHRLAAALALGEPQRVVPVLQQSARDFPQDYNPPARLALAYLAMREPQRALEQATRAESLVYGPRTLRVLLTKAEAQAAVGDTHGARATLARAEQFVWGLPAAQRTPGMQTAIAAKRKALFEPPTAAAEPR